MDQRLNIQLLPTAGYDAYAKIVAQGVATPDLLKKFADSTTGIPVSTDNEEQVLELTKITQFLASCQGISKSQFLKDIKEVNPDLAQFCLNHKPEHYDPAAFEPKVEELTI